MWNSIIKNGSPFTWYERAFVSLNMELTLQPYPYKMMLMLHYHKCLCSTLLVWYIFQHTIHHTAPSISSVFPAPKIFGWLASKMPHSPANTVTNLRIWAEMSCFVLSCSQQQKILMHATISLMNNNVYKKISTQWKECKRCSQNHILHRWRLKPS